MHKDMLIGKTRLDDHHIQSIDVTELNGLKEVNNKIISQETTFMEFDFLKNPIIAQKVIGGNSFLTLLGFL